MKESQSRIPIGSALQLLQFVLANHNAELASEIVIAFLADSVAPRSGDIWKQFYISLFSVN